MKNSDDESDSHGHDVAQIGSGVAGQDQHREQDDTASGRSQDSLEGAGSRLERAQVAPESEGSALKAGLAASADQRSEEVVDAAAASVQAAMHVREAAETAAEAVAEIELEAEVAAPSNNTEGMGALGIALVVVLVAVLSAVLGPNVFGTGSDVGRGDSESISIIAATVRDIDYLDRSSGPVDQVWDIKGQVLFENNPADGAIVYAVLRDQSGNEYTSNIVKNTMDGGFEIKLNLGKYDEAVRPRAEQILVTASLTREDEGFWWFSGDPSSHQRTAELRPEPTGGSRWSRKSAAPFLSALVIFGFSILVGMVPVRGAVWQASKYFSVALLGVIFTAWMIYFISITIQTLGGSSRSDEVISLGFAHVFYGGYVKDAKGEWILSLTTPEARTANVERGIPSGATPDVVVDAEKEAIAIQTAEAVPAQAVGDGKGAAPVTELPPATVEGTVQSGRMVSTGFGAPLWLLLLSVVGASVFTIKTVLENLEQPGEFDDLKVRARVATILRHQFYILFAPLGAVFVYQLLVAAGSASEPITVGLAALASGIALSSVLERAWQAVETVTGRERRTSAASPADNQG